MSTHTFSRPQGSRLSNHALTLLAGLSASLATGLTACTSTPSASGPRTAQATLDGTIVSEPIIVLDGDLSDWPAANPPNPTAYTVALADEHHLSMRFTIEGERYTLQSDDAPTAIMLDVDASASTGWQPEATGELSTLGVDLMVEFSPRREDGKPGRGVTMWQIASSGERTRTSVYDWDFSFTPTVASDWYEARISRTPTGSVLVPSQGLLSTGEVAGAFVRYDTTGTIAATSEVFLARCAERCLDAARKSNVTIPAKQPGALRVVSYNVLRSKPTQVPDVYQRIFKALDPDIILLQEWEVASSRELAEWFNANLMRAGGWDAIVAPGKVMEGAGLGIVSKVPMSTVENNLRLAGTREDPNFDDDRVRYVLGEATTPLGSVLVGSLHLKSAGRAGSVEDRKRIAEAGAINQSVLAASRARTPQILILGGDVNLVGSHTPLDTLIAGLDLDGSDLAVAQPRKLGDRTFVTWTEAGNAFSPGRLDYIVYSDSRAVVSRSFVLDTSRLSSESLAQSGLQPDDTALASDHLPVVVDMMLPVR